MDHGIRAPEVLAILIAIAYGPTLLHLIATTPLTTPGFRVW